MHQLDKKISDEASRREFPCARCARLRLLRCRGCDAVAICNDIEIVLLRPSSERIRRILRVIACVGELDEAALSGNHVVCADFRDLLRFGRHIGFLIDRDRMYEARL